VLGVVVLVWVCSRDFVGSDPIQEGFFHEGDVSDTFSTYNLTGSDPIIMCENPIVNFSLPTFEEGSTERRMVSVENIDHFEGKCVGVKWTDRGGAQYVTTVVGTDPDELFRRADCSPVANGRNVPSGWDFSGNGRCGKADNGNGYWRDCLIHDTCVWKNCHQDDAIPGGMVLMRIVGNDPSLDKDCGDEYDAAVDDWVTANICSCEENSDCVSGRCGWLHGRHCLPKLALDEYCHQHEDCDSGRCALVGFHRSCQLKISPGASEEAKTAATSTATVAGTATSTTFSTVGTWSFSEVLSQIYRFPSTFKDAVSLYHRRRCIWHEDCAPDAWCSLFSVGFGGLWVDYLSCKPLKPLKEVCTRDAQCASGRCAGNPFVVSSHGLRCREKIPTWEQEKAREATGRAEDGAQGGSKGAKAQGWSLTATIQAAIHADHESSRGEVDDDVMFGCESDSDCVSGRCAWNGTSSAEETTPVLALHQRRLRCLPLLGVDAACEANSDCASGRCAMTANTGWQLRCLEKMEVYNSGSLQLIP